jgi:hypothetical protein
MSEDSVLNWIEGRGWLILSGGADALGEVRSMALARMNAIGRVAYVSLDDDGDEALMDDMADLGAPTGYIVNVMVEDDETIRERLADVGLVVIPGEAGVGFLRSSLLGAALDGVRDAYERGAVIFAEGEAASLFGVSVVDEDGAILDGFGWVDDSYIAIGVTSVADSDYARQVLTSGKATVGIGVNIGSALALGPAGSIETWGEGQVTIALGGNRLSLE